MCVRERERVCVRESVCERERERERVCERGCVCERERVCERENDLSPSPAMPRVASTIPDPLFPARLPPGLFGFHLFEFKVWGVGVWV